VSSYRAIRWSAVLLRGLFCNFELGEMYTLLNLFCIDIEGL
jgi:hypothetical protein